MKYIYYFMRHMATVLIALVDKFLLAYLNQENLDDLLLPKSL